MESFISGINGPIIGKVGSVCGFSRNSIFYIEGPLKKRTPTVSAKELAERKRFKTFLTKRFLLFGNRDGFGDSASVPLVLLQKNPGY